jgi:fatty acid desaturase
MFFHAEHHLFPAVPTGHLHVLAQRLDAAMPEVSRRQVLSFGGIEREGTEWEHGGNISHKSVQAI